MSKYRVNLGYESWGRAASVPHEVARPQFPDELDSILEGRRQDLMLPVGLMRSYGDSNLNPGRRLIDMTGLDRLIAFDEKTGILTCDAGVALCDLNPIVVRHGWFVPTTPGTEFVTVGGAVANDVHGKNHHAAGSFGCSVQGLDLLRSDGQVLSLRKGDAQMDATIGGLGLTGIILNVTFQLVAVESAWLDNERIAFSSVDEFFKLAEESEFYEHTVSWIDCAATGANLGRGVFQRANWSKDKKFGGGGRKSGPKLPFDFPSWALNRYSIRAFNVFYNSFQQAGPSQRKEHYKPFFYPLDAIGQWNRMYGASGFYQYQCVLPKVAAQQAVRELLKVISTSGQGSFLAVLKTMGPKQSGGMLSFPMEGATLALDFANRGARTLHLLAQLDTIVVQAGGRLYPAKDGRMSAAVFQNGYPLWEEFSKLKDPRMNSAFWERVSR